MARMQLTRNTLDDYDPTEEPADLALPLTVQPCDRALREHAALALRAMLGDLDAYELYDLSEGQL